jgi:hypothetical protein
MNLVEENPFYFGHVTVQAVCGKLERAADALFQVDHVFLAGYGIALSDGRIDDEFAFGVDAKENVLLANLAGFGAVIALFAVDEAKEFVALDKLKRMVADFGIHQGRALLARDFENGQNCVTVNVRQARNGPDAMPF